jgi:YjeF C-terminal domain protein
MRVPFLYDTNLLDLIPKRKKDSNKGTFGHVLVIAGSYGMSGAAYLAALSAYRTGAGLVKIFTVDENRQILQTLLPEAIITSYNPNETDKENFMAKLKTCIYWSDCIIIGPGMGTKDYALDILEEVLMEAYVPLIIDADALNIISKNQYLTGYYTENIIITPHLLEMSRLTGKNVEEIKENKIETACDYQDKYKVTVVLKSSETIITSREDYLYINTSGSAALAKAGTGDVLTGVIAGLICLGLEDYKAASLACYIHGLAGEAAAKKIGEHGVIARDVVNYIPYIMSGKYTIRGEEI